MTDTDQLLRDLTSDVDDATPMAQARIRTEVLRRLAPAPPRRGWRRPARLVPLAAAGVAATVAVALVAPWGGGGPSLVERAQAAIAPPGEIVQAVITIMPPGDAGEPLVLREWTLSRPDGAWLTRTVANFGTGDIETTAQVGTDGRLAQRAMWLDGELMLGVQQTVQTPDGTIDVNSEQDPPIAQMLSDAYRDGRLKEAGTTPDGAIRLTGSLEDAPGCTSTDEVLLDPGTLLPTALENRTTCRPPDGGPATEETARVSVRFTRVPATPENLRLVRMSDRPVTRAVRIDPAKGLAAGTPVPVAEARREAGMD